MERISGIISANYSADMTGQLTRERVVASLPFGGRYRLIDFPLSNMMNFGITSVGILTPYKYRSMLDHIGSGKPWALDRKRGGLFILPGTVFGVSSSESRFLLRDFIRNKAFLLRSTAQYVIVSSANTVCNINFDDLCKAHFDSGADITMLYSRAKADERYLTGLTLENDRVTGYARGAAAGDAVFIDCFMIGKEFFLKIMEWYANIDYLDIFDAIRYDLDKMDVRGCEFTGYSGGIFDVASYFDRSMELLDPAVRNELFRHDSPVMTKIQDTVPSKYMGGCTVKNSLIPAGCTIEGRVENSILFRNVKVAPGAVVKNSIVMQSCRIGENAVLENVIIDRDNIIAASSVLKGTEKEALIIPKAE